MLQKLKDGLLWAIKAPIHLYVLFISPWLGSNCRFEPTCSAYTLKALEKHGALKGLYLGAKRVLKCHPYHKGCRHDPVPESFNWAIDWKIPFLYKHTNR